MTIILKQSGAMIGASSLDAVVRGMAQFQARVGLDAVTALTNDAGGSAGNSIAIVAADLTNKADVSTSSAGKTAGEAAMTTVLAALGEIFAKANEAAGILGLDTTTYSGGGGSTDGTVGAITVAVTAATTGIPAAAFNTYIGKVNEATYNAAILVNRLCEATGVAGLAVGFAGTPVSTVAAISTATGTAADPCVSKADADTKLTAIRANLTSIAAKLNATLAGPGSVPVVAQ